MRLMAWSLHPAPHQDSAMKVVITGGCGFLGQRVALSLIAKAQFCGGEVERVVLVDKFAAPLAPALQKDPRVVVVEKVPLACLPA